MKRAVRLVLVIVALTIAAAIISCSSETAFTSQQRISSGDAYVAYDSTTQTWTMGTAKVEKKIQLTTSGQFLLVAFKNKLSDREYINGDTLSSEEFSIKVNSDNCSGLSKGWIYDSYNLSLLKQKEIQLVITIHNGALQVKRNYVIYPETGVIQEWSIFKNISGATAKFSFPAIFNQRIMQKDVDNVDFHYMTGGGNFTGSHVLKTVKLSSDYTRVFDSYDKPEAIMIDGKLSRGVADNKQGASIWNEFYALRNRASNDGVFLTFDYMGHWTSRIGNWNGNILLQGCAYVSDLDVKADQTLTSPKSMTGVFTGDLDDMGNAILDYIYRYKWDYTNDEYFAKVKANFRYWTANARGFKSSSRESIFDAVNQMRYIGADQFFYGWGWQNVVGDWNYALPEYDFKAVNDYVRKHQMQMGIWLPVWNAEAESKVFAENPDWRTDKASKGYYGSGLNQALPEVVEWELNMLNSKQNEWGPHVCREDGTPCWPVNGSDNDMLGQSENFFNLLKRFRDTNPDAGIYGCASGGQCISIEATRYVDAQQCSDGKVLHYDGYWGTLLMAPDKLTSLSNALFDTVQWGRPYGKWNRGNLRQSWTVLLYEPNAEMSFEDKEDIRKDIELYHYLKTQDVVGRWVKVYRPAVSENADPTYFLQKMNKDKTKGYITMRRYDAIKGQDMTIYPKGLNASQNYTVSFISNASESTNTGSYWMAKGIELKSMDEGEIIFFNINNRPGTGKDTVVPGAPTKVRKLKSTYMNRSGIELTWTAAKDNNWISYYEIFKNGKAIDKVSIGTFYFTIDANVNDTFEVRTVDGDGNVSAIVQAAK